MPIFSKPYRNLETDKPLYKAELLREISARTMVKEYVVEEVLETFKQVAIEEIVNKGEFNFSGLFSVSNYHVKASTSSFGHSPERKRLRTKLSDRVKKIWNGRFKAGVTEPENYSELKEAYLDKKSSSVRDSIGLLAPSEQAPGFNPMLDDDDEY